MESEISFYFTGDYDQAMDAALKLIPKTAKARTVQILSASVFTAEKAVTVKFTNSHKYADITDAADFFDNEPTEGETNANQRI